LLSFSSVIKQLNYQIAHIVFITNIHNKIIKFILLMDKILLQTTIALIILQILLNQKHIKTSIFQY